MPTADQAQNVSGVVSASAVCPRTCIARAGAALTESGRALGTSKHFWLGLQADYDLEEAEHRFGARLKEIETPAREIFAHRTHMQWDAAFALWGRLHSASSILDPSRRFSQIIWRMRAFCAALSTRLLLTWSHTPI